MSTITPSSYSLSPKGSTPQELQRDHVPVLTSTANTPNQTFDKPSCSAVSNGVNPGVKIDDDNPVGSLEQLLKCILTIIHGYSDLSHSSSLYLSSLDHYRLRLEKLLSVARRLQNDPSPAVDLNNDDDGDCDHRQDPEIDMPSRQDLMREIYKLEEEWWNSEVVRARRHRISSRDLTALTEEEHELPNDYDVMEERTKAVNRGNAATQAQISILGNVGWLRRDSSYVGLHDE